MLGAILAAALAAAPAAASSDTFARDYADTRGYTRGRPSAVTVAPDGKTVLYLESGPRSAKLGLFAYDVASGKSAELVTPAELLGGKQEQISVEEQARRERARQTEQGFTDYALSKDGARVLLPLSGKIWVLERASKALHAVYQGGDAAIDPQLSPDATRVAYVRSNDLYVADVASGKETRLTTGGTDDLTHGLAEFVAQEELSRSHGFWWAPDGKSILYEESDTKDVEHFVISDPSKPSQPGNRFPYPRAGKANAKIRFGLIPSTGGATTWLTWDHDAWPYVSSVLWDSGARPVIEVRSRDQRDLAYLAVDASGATTPFFHEHDDAWLDTTDCPRGVDHCGPVQLADGRIVRIAQTPKAWALQVVEPSGASKVVQPESFGARLVLAADGKDAYVLASDDPTDEPLWRVPLDGSKPVKLTAEQGEHTPFFTAGAPLFVDDFTDATHLPAAQVRALDGSVKGELPSQAERPPFAPNPEFTTVSAEGLTFHALILRPHGFKKGKRYPVIDSVYGGPTANVVVRAESGLLLDQWYADHGFIVVRIDNRGTPRRDRAWEKAVLGDLGALPMQDQVAALQALAKKFPELDLKRAGMWGWSFGGYMSALAALSRPDVFKAAVAMAPVVDWADYDSTYTERYMRTPQDNAKGYEHANLLSHAKSLKVPLLLMHGTADDNVYFFHSLRLVNALYLANQRLDFQPIVGQTHIVSDPAYRAILYGRVVDYFEKHLAKVK